MLTFAACEDELKSASVFIVAVPTPVNDAHQPDFSPLIAASQSVGRALKVGDVVIYESTVYPGATEDVCIPLLEAASGLVFNRDFFVGYRPERINPGQASHTARPFPDYASLHPGYTDCKLHARGSGDVQRLS